MDFNEYKKDCNKILNVNDELQKLFIINIKIALKEMVEVVKIRHNLRCFFVMTENLSLFASIVANAITLLDIAALILVIKT